MIYNKRYIIFVSLALAGVCAAAAGEDPAATAEKEVPAGERTPGFASASTISIWGERIASWALPVTDGISSGAGTMQDWAGRTWTDLGDNVRNGRCIDCGAPTLLNRAHCFHCVQRARSEEVLTWLSETKNSARDSLRKLSDPKLTEPVIDRLIQARDYFRERQKTDPTMIREQRRQMLELLGRTPLGSGGRTLNEIAKDTIKNYMPALEDTDYADDPARAISYFLILDGKGFLEHVRCVKMKDGRVLTPIGAYQEYTHTDPARAKDMLEVIEDIRRLSDPLNTNEDRLPAALDALARSLRLMTP